MCFRLDSVGLQVWECDGSDSQLFALTPFDEGYQIQVKASLTCLTQQGLGWWDTWNFGPQTCTSDVTQKFKLVRVGE